MSAPRVLVVDDERDVRLSFSLYLSRAGFAVEEADSLEAARQAVAARSVDCVLLDLNLPDGNGMDWIHDLRETQPATAILVITGRGDIPLAVEAMRRGADHFLTKPPDMGEVEVFIRKSLELGGKDLIPLEIELGLARDFLAIEQVRFGARLAVHAEGSAESLTCLVPSLLLQPLVENAVTHGIAQTVQGGEVRIESSIRGERLSIVVANPCDEAAPARRRRGFGLDNTRNRLAALYAREAGLQTRKDGERFVVELTLPATRMR